MNRILFVENDALFRESIAEFLSEEGFFVEGVSSFEEAIEASFNRVFDLYLLDINLSGRNGIELLQELRDFGDQKPTLMLTSHNSAKIVSDCFEKGCDDFIKKPCDPIELLARIKSKLRDSFGHKTRVVKIGDGLEFDLDKKIVLKQGKEISIGQKGLELLSLLVKYKNRTVTLELIERELWSASEEPSYASIRVYINSLKKLLGKDSITNIKGVGYRLDI